MLPSSPAAAVAKICFNFQCKEPLPDLPPARRKGWRLRSGEIAELCDRCSCTFEQGNFCETYHSEDGGWRNCEAFCHGLLRYFPAISQPEGLPLKVKDANGKDWVFQFRFWPNNNSRMHVWEGVTPCIQAMQLHAGDTVTFSRMDPKGTLIMGFRKASGASNEQDSQTLKSGNDFSSPPEADCKITAKHLKGSVETRNLASTVGVALSLQMKACYKKMGLVLSHHRALVEEKVAILGLRINV